METGETKRNFQWFPYWTNRREMDEGTHSEGVTVSGWRKSGTEKQTV